MEGIATNNQRPPGADWPTADRRPPMSVVEQPAAAAEGIFRGNGEYWSVGLREHQALLKDRKGLRYLASLLHSPGSEICVLDLMKFSGCWQQTDAGGNRGAGAAASGIQWRSVGECLRALGDAGPMLDRQAKSAYERRLFELREAREVAEAKDDALHAQQIEEEVEALRRELSRAFDYHG